MENPMNAKVTFGDMNRAMTAGVGKEAHERLEKKRGEVWVKGEDKDLLIQDAKGYAASTKKRGKELVDSFLEYEDKALDLNDGQIAALREILQDLPEFN
jgi:hypothetical protein